MMHISNSQHEKNTKHTAEITQTPLHNKDIDTSILSNIKGDEIKEAVVHTMLDIPLKNKPDTDNLEVFHGFNTSNTQLKDSINIITDNNIPHHLKLAMLGSNKAGYNKTTTNNHKHLSNLLDKTANDNKSLNLLNEIHTNNTDKTYTKSLLNIATIRNIQNNAISKSGNKGIGDLLKTDDALDVVIDKIKGYSKRNNNIVTRPNTNLNLANHKQDDAIKTLTAQSLYLNNYQADNKFSFGIAKNNGFMSNSKNNHNGNILLCSVSVMMQLSYAVSSILGNVMDTVQRINDTVSYFKSFGSLMKSIETIDKSTIDKALVDYNKSHTPAETIPSFNVLLSYYSSGKANTNEIEQIKNFLQELGNSTDQNNGTTYADEFQDEFGCNLVDFKYNPDNIRFPESMLFIGSCLNSTVTKANNYVDSMPSLCGNTGKKYNVDMFGEIDTTKVLVPGGISLGNVQTNIINNETTVAGGTQNNNTTMNQEATLLSAIWQAISMLLSNIKETYNNTAGRA